jgi:hypothetical protein
MDTSPINLQALIAETEALDWDGPPHLESLPIEYPKQATFGLIGKLLPAKPPHPQWVHDTLVRIKVEIDTLKPLVLGFHFPCLGTYLGLVSL